MPQSTLHIVPATEPAPRIASSRHRFAFAGVAFEVLAGEGVAWELPEACARMCTPIDAGAPGEIVADVICSVRTGHLAAERSGTSQTAQPGELRVGTASVSAEIRALGAHRYAVAALVEADDPRASEQVLALTSSVVARMEHAGRLASAAQARVRG